MKRSVLLATFLAACSSTHTMVGSKNYPPLPKDAPVEVFYSEPDLRYEKVCEIAIKRNNSLASTWRTREDFAGAFQDEARQCGADGVIISSVIGFESGNVDALGLGIKILSKKAEAMSDERIKTFSLAVQSGDIAQIRKSLGAIPKERAQRAPSDESLIGSGLYLAASEGFKCRAPVIQLLEKEYEGHIPKFGLIKTFDLQHHERDVIFCADVAANSYPSMSDKAAAVLSIHNDYVDVLNEDANDLDKKARAFQPLIKLALTDIVTACKSEGASPLCALKQAYREVAEKSVKRASRAVRAIATDIKKTLK